MMLNASLYGVLNHNNHGMELFPISHTNSPIDISDLLKADWGKIKGCKSNVSWYVALNDTHENKGNSIVG